MAESNLDFKNLPVATGVTLSDFVVLSLFGGTSSRISVGLFRSAITDGLRPVIGEDGYWYVGDISTEVLAEGKTPEFRKATNCIEFKYTTENDDSWRPLIMYSDLRLRFEDLKEEQYDTFRLHFEDLTEENIKELQKPAIEAAERILLALDVDEDGNMIATYGRDFSDFSDGRITDDGEVVLEFNYE